MQLKINVLMSHQRLQFSYLHEDYYLDIWQSVHKFSWFKSALKYQGIRSSSQETLYSAGFLDLRLLSFKNIRMGLSDEVIRALWWSLAYK